MKNLADLLALRDTQKTDLQEKFNALFDIDETLQRSIKKCENLESGWYSLDDFGLGYCTDLDTEYDYSECMDELKAYILDTTGLYIDWQQDRTLFNSCGDEFYAIQDESSLGSETVVYQQGDEVARLDNDLDDAWDDLYCQINKHMESQGCFPEVIYVDDHGGVELCHGFYQWLKKHNAKETK